MSENWRWVPGYEGAYLVSDISSNRRPVMQIADDGKTIRFDCAESAARAYGIRRTGIVNCCRGVQKTAAGFTWRYVING